MTQTVSVAADAQRQQQGQIAQPDEVEVQDANSMASGGMAVPEAIVAATRFEQSVLALNVQIAPGILGLRPEDVLAHLSSTGFALERFVFLLL